MNPDLGVMLATRSTSSKFLSSLCPKNCYEQKCLVSILFCILFFIQMCWYFRERACMTHEWRKPDLLYVLPHVFPEYSAGLLRCKEHKWVMPTVSTLEWEAAMNVASHQGGSITSPTSPLPTAGSSWGFSWHVGIWALLWWLQAVMTDCQHHILKMQLF